MLFKQKMLAFSKLKYDTQRYQVIWLGKKYDQVPESKFTLCIPTYNRAEQLSKLLRAIYDLRVGNEGYLRFPIPVPSMVIEMSGAVDKYKLTQDVQFVTNYGEQTFGGNLHNLVCHCQTDYLVLMGDDDWISWVTLVNY